MLEAKAPLSITKLIKIKVPKGATIAIVGRSLKKFVRILVKTFSIGKVIPEPQNVKMPWENIDNMFVCGKRLLLMQKKSLTKKTGFLAKRRRDSVTLLKELVLVKEWAGFVKA